MTNAKNMEQQIEILYHDEHIIAVNKPIDLPIHPNEFMAKDAPYLNKLIGEQIDKRVYNVHRIDAKTSGIVLLALSSEVAKTLTLQFEHKEVKKTYFAIVLGETENEGIFDSKVVVKKKSNFRKNAITRYKTIKTVSTGIEHKEMENAKISLVEINPETGRWHQIRQHFAKNMHDIIGDKKHGDFAFNRTIADLTDIRRLFLHAGRIEFAHPVNNEKIVLEAPIPESFLETLNKFAYQKD